MNSCKQTAFITAVDNMLVSKFNNRELGSIAAALVQLGDTLVTITINRDLCKSKTSIIEK